MVYDNQGGFYFKNNNGYSFPCKQVIFFSTSKYI